LRLEKEKDGRKKRRGSHPWARRGEDYNYALILAEREPGLL